MYWKKKTSFIFTGREPMKVEHILDALPNLEQYVINIGPVDSHKNNPMIIFFLFVFFMLLKLYHRYI